MRSAQESSMAGTVGCIGWQKKVVDKGEGEKRNGPDQGRGPDAEARSTAAQPRHSLSTGLHTRFSFSQRNH
jgi:hypothetical protein